MASAASVTPMLATVAVREPPEPLPGPTMSLSPWSTCTESNGTPSRSEATCANVVSWPWPPAWPVRVTVSSPDGWSTSVTRLSM